MESGGAIDAQTWPPSLERRTFDGAKAMLGAFGSTTVDDELAPGRREIIH